MPVQNTPELWKDIYPIPDEKSHKYTRGHAVVLAGKMLGSAILASRAARRVGAGLTTIICEKESYPIIASQCVGTMVSALSEDKRYTEHLVDEKKDAFLLSSGGGVSDELKTLILFTLKMGPEKGVVIDADGLNVFKFEPQSLFNALHENCVITPHEAEFSRLFPDLVESREKNALAAAARAGCVVVLKGASTVIASPKGDVVVNTHASPFLASAGTGDVLAGMILGLLAQGVCAFDAAKMAVWVHGDAGKRLGMGLIAEDVVEEIPAVLKNLFKE